MNATRFLHSAQQLFQPTQFQLAYKRLLIPIIMLVLLANENTREITVTTLSDSFWAVSCYVAATLAIYHYLSNLCRRRIASLSSIIALVIIRCFLQPYSVRFRAVAALLLLRLNLLVDE